MLESLNRSARFICFSMVVAGVAACTASLRPVSYGWDDLPFEKALRQPRPDQQETLHTLGLPTAIWRTNLATRYWVYCSTGRVFRMVEYDINGRLLGEFGKGEAFLCSTFPEKVKSSTAPQERLHQR